MESAGLSSPPPAAKRLARTLASISWMALPRVFLGALFVTVFYENLNKDLYTLSGYAGLINGYAAQNNAPGFWNDIMGFVADHADLFAAPQAVFEMALGVVLVLGLLTPVVALVAGAFLTALWVSEIGIFWVWELLSVMLVALLVVLATLPSFLSASSWKERLLGPRTFGSLALPARLGLAVLGGGALALAVVAAQTGGPGKYDDVALQSGVTFMMLLVGLALLDERRPQ